MSQILGSPPLLKLNPTRPFPPEIAHPFPTRSRSRGRRRSVHTACERMDDGHYMRRCVELARTAVGRTAPNPMVGCVIVDGGGRIVGEGFHPKAGQPHAEVFALKDAGSSAENATAYVSLEPCNHYGRTPPCTEALIGAKVKRVVVGMVDPNPIVASKGVERLRGSGIDVTVGIEEKLCQKLNEAYIHRMVTGKPFAALRYSLSPNGRIVNQLGKGAEESGGYYSKLLQEYDAVVVPRSMLTASLPSSQETGAKQPLHIIIASGVSSSLHLPVSIMESADQIIVLADKSTIVEPESKGIEVIVLEKFSLSSILDFCGRLGFCSILFDLRGDDECFIELIRDGIQEHLVQKVVVEIPSFTERSEETSILPFGDKSLQLKDLQSRNSNENVIVEGYIS
ncbi:riboflavin biosynthesis protein PYRD, chloroplastic [Iris pallida]|uniref:Riboflavin biosynthesis protein PYRD, chloroplastic n=1 Tax=Iris pallida TaxID=29817 RepID=A0AAX6DXE9_IRIPA|nr:riboflavin biosynthesis protein PYRD, chloroplastic [Iris pallida]